LPYSDWEMRQSINLSIRYKPNPFCVLLKDALRMDNEKDHICSIMLYKIRKGKSVSGTTKYNLKIYLDHAQ